MTVLYLGPDDDGEGLVTSQARLERESRGAWSEAADHASAYLPGDRRRALAAGVELPTQVVGAALFADISGFTPLTEALLDELGSQRASEAITGHLNRVFHAVIAELDRYGGDVIYFSGDAITCWLDGDDGTRAAACGLAMQVAMAREGAVTTPAGRSLQLALKVAVASGPARRFVVGDPQLQLIDVLAGNIVDRLADAEHLASPGEVVIEQSAIDAVAGSFELGEKRADDQVAVQLLGAPLVEVPEAPLPEDDGELPDELTRPWLLREVFDRLSTGRGEFLAELRPAYPVFVSFSGIDFENDETAAERLDELVQAAQRILSGYGGNVLQLTLGDKGAYLYGVFGTPVAHEDDAARACAAALELQQLASTTAAEEIRVGITHGRLRSGTYGHDRRRTFVCLGDAVNLAARLMSRAPGSETYVSELVRRRAGDEFSWSELEPLQLKGKSQAVAAFSLAGRSGKRTRRVVRYELPIVGRDQELAVLDARLADSLQGKGQLVGIPAEAGMGKSRLIAEFVREVRARGLLVGFGECQPYGTSASYFVWREIWRTLLGIPEQASAAAQVEAAEAALAAIDPRLVARAPLLDAVLGLAIPDSELTATFDAKLRKTSLENLLSRCLRGRAGKGLVLVLEDCHWLDPLSRELLEVLVRAARSSPVLLVLAYRPEAALADGLALRKLSGLQELPLDALGEEGMATVVRDKVGQLFDTDSEPDGRIVDLVVERAQGNPFYAEELLNYVHAQQVDLSDHRAVEALDLPDSLHSLVLSRIDTLTESPRQTIKIASVIGRVFQAPALPGVYPAVGSLDDVRAYLGTLRELDLVSPDREEDESYLFRHAVTREVAYESLPFALRATLHTHVGDYLERQHADDLEQNLDLLAHHFWHSDDDVRKRHYLGLAAAAAQSSYANAAAIDYYERLATLLEGAAQARALLELGRVLELVGQWDRARTVELQALTLADEAGGGNELAWCETALAELARKQGAYPEAGERLGRAATIFEQGTDEAGLAQVLHLKGTLAAQQGRYEEARAGYEASLVIRKRLGDRKMQASALSNLGVVAEYEGDYKAARALNEQALELRIAEGDRWAIAVSETNLGMIAILEKQFDEARGRFEEAMQMNAEVGDGWMVAISNNNLGNANRGLGELVAARANYAEAVHALAGYGDQWALGFLFEDIAVLAGIEHDAETAFELLGAADAMREQSGSPRGDWLATEIETQLAEAAATLGPEEAAATRERGAQLTIAEATTFALKFCMLRP